MKSDSKSSVVYSASKSWPGNRNKCGVVQLSFIDKRSKFTGYLMSKDIIIGEIIEDEIVNIRNKCFINSK